MKAVAIGAGVGALFALLWAHMKNASAAFGPLTSKTWERVSYPMPAAQRVALHQGASKVMTEAFTAEFGRAPNGDELQVLLAVANLETGYGNGWNNARCPGSQSSNNWGAVQATKSDPAQFPCTDTFPDGTSYQQGFKTYPTPVDGARDVVKHVFKHRPAVADSIADPSTATIWRFSLTMRRKSYYGSWCKKTVAKYGSIDNHAQTNPIKEADIECEKEAAGLHVDTMLAKIKEIAPSVGVSALPVGTYEDALSWYQNRA